MSNLAQCFTYKKHFTNILISLTSKITHIYIYLLPDIQIATFQEVFLSYAGMLFSLLGYHIQSLCRQMQAWENVS